MTAATPKPGKGWRLLKVGEVIEYGDESWLRSRGWGETVCQGGEMLEHDLLSGYFVRRRTHQGVKPVKEPDWHRIALAMSKARTIGEARKIYERGKR